MLAVAAAGLSRPRAFPSAKQLLCSMTRGMNAFVPWSIERDGSALHIHITGPVVEQWDALMNGIHDHLKPRPLAIHLPSRIEGGTETDAVRLTVLWEALGALGIPLLPPPG